MNILSSYRKCKNLVLFIFLALACYLVKRVELVDAVVVAAEENVSTSHSKNGESVAATCDAQSNTISILVVGLLSSVVFSFVGILPALFIRTDADEEKFSKFSFF